MILNIHENLGFAHNIFHNRSFSKHFHDDYYFSLIYDGNLNLNNEDEELTLSSNMIQVANPYVMHSIENSTWSSMNIILSIELVNEIAREIIDKEITGIIKFNTIIDDSDIIHLFRNLFNAISSKNQLTDKYILSEFLESILLNHSTYNFSKTNNTKCNKRDLKKALEYINDIDMKDNLSLEDISSEIGISKFHFQKEFKKYMGLTPNQYIQIRKANLAKKMIQKKIPLSHIAYECGFSDQSYMIKVFKRYYGYTPSNLNSFSN